MDQSVSVAQQSGSSCPRPPGYLSAGQSRGVSSVSWRKQGRGFTCVSVYNSNISNSVFKSHGRPYFLFSLSEFTSQRGREGGRRSRGSLLTSHYCTVQYTDTVPSPFLRS